MKEKKTKKQIVSWVLQIMLAGLFLMAAVPKLTGDPMAAAMVAKLGLGGWAVYAIGLTELVAAVLLVIPRTVAYGALLGLGVLGGAILSHVTVLGISLGEADGGAMFMMATVGLVIAGIITYLKRRPLMMLIGREAMSHS
ncbi:MAG: DoxX family protein [Oceanipulchritudo sp.]